MVELDKLRTSKRERMIELESHLAEFAGEASEKNCEKFTRDAGSSFT